MGNNTSALQKEWSLRCILSRKDQTVRCYGPDARNELKAAGKYFCDSDVNVSNNEYT